MSNVYFHFINLHNSFFRSQILTLEDESLLVLYWKSDTHVSFQFWPYFCWRIQGEGKIPIHPARDSVGKATTRLQLRNKGMQPPEACRKKSPETLHVATRACRPLSIFNQGSSRVDAEVAPTPSDKLRFQVGAWNIHSLCLDDQLPLLGKRSSWGLMWLLS